MGDLVVHIDHGIGRFLGVREDNLDPKESKSQTLIVEYAKESKLFVPINQIERLTKYIGAPMPGLILDVVVSEGDEVEKGDKLLVLEAMKMENILKSPEDGSIKKIKVRKGKVVEKNDMLVSIA